LVFWNKKKKKKKGAAGAEFWALQTPKVAVEGGAGR
jgi:hypothetical protein